MPEVAHDEGADDDEDNESLDAVENDPDLPGEEPEQR
jgi:hypothetical protein